MAQASQVDCIQVLFGAPGHFSAIAGGHEEGRIRTRAECHVHISNQLCTTVCIRLEYVVHVLNGECGVQGRLKSIYSIYKKMIRKKIPVRQVYDARALRIIVDDEGGSRTGDAWAAAYR